jgi:hypothetical protein
VRRIRFDTLTEVVCSRVGRRASGEEAQAVTAPANMNNMASMLEEEKCIASLTRERFAE